MFLIACMVIVPIIMIFIGIVWSYAPPKRINSWYGYRTSLSMANQKAWDFAHQHCSKVVLLFGSGLLIVVFIVIIKAKTDRTLLVIFLSEPVVLLVSTLPTTIALKKKFKRS